MSSSGTGMSVVDQGVVCLQRRDFPLFSHGACLCADPAGSGGRVRILAIVVAIIGALAELVWIAENWFLRAGSTLRT
jgi:hypothetical protein